MVSRRLQRLASSLQWCWGRFVFLIAGRPIQTTPCADQTRPSAILNVGAARDRRTRSSAARLIRCILTNARVIVWVASFIFPGGHFWRRYYVRGLVMSNRDRAAILRQNVDALVAGLSELESLEIACSRPSRECSAQRVQEGERWSRGLSWPAADLHRPRCHSENRVCCRPCRRRSFGSGRNGWRIPWTRANPPTP